jgi:hypothetical protein
VLSRLSALETVPANDKIVLMKRVLEFLKSMHEDVLKWCGEHRMWYVRLPFLLWFAYMLVNHLADPMYTSLFGGINLGIHELGHFVFMPFGEFLHAAGGTILQCAAPVIVMAGFYRMRDYFAITICFGWLSTNFFSVATYVADARALALPLVTPGGGPAKHDWNYLLGRMGMLHRDLTFAFMLRVAAVISMIICFIGGGYILYRMIKPYKEPPLVEYKSRIS